MDEVLEKIDELAEDAYDLLKEAYETMDSKNIEEAMYKAEGIHDVIFMYQDAMRGLRRKL